MAETTGFVKTNNEDIALSFLRENFCFNLTRDEFSKIDARLFCSILAKFLDDFGVDNYSQLDLLAIQGVSDIENYEETTQVINLWQAVAQLLSPLGLSDFTLGDVLQPRKPKALKVIMYLIRLWDKYVAVYAEWMKIEQQFAEIPERKRIIESENKELQSNLEEKSCFLATLRNENGSQEQKLTAAADAQSKLLTVGHSLNDESRALKLEIVTKKEQLSEITLQTTQLKQQIEEVQAQIVHSPDKLIAEIDHKEKELEDLRIEKLTLDKEYTVTSQDLQNLETAMKQSDAAMDILSQTTGDLENLKDEVRKVENIKSDLHKKEQKLAELRAVCQKDETNIQQIVKQKGLASIQQAQRLKPTKELNENWIEKRNQLLETETKLVAEYEEQEQQVSEQFTKKKMEHENFMAQLAASKEIMFTKNREYSEKLSYIRNGMRKYAS